MWPFVPTDRSEESGLTIRTSSSRVVCIRVRETLPGDGFRELLVSINVGNWGNWSNTCTSSWRLTTFNLVASSLSRLDQHLSTSKWPDPSATMRDPCPKSNILKVGMKRSCLKVSRIPYNVRFCDLIGQLSSYSTYTGSRRAEYWNWPIDSSYFDYWSSQWFTLVLSLGFRTASVDHSWVSQ